MRSGLSLWMFPARFPVALLLPGVLRGAATELFRKLPARFPVTSPTAGSDWFGEQADKMLPAVPLTVGPGWPCRPEKRFRETVSDRKSCRGWTYGAIMAMASSSMCILFSGRMRPSAVSGGQFSWDHEGGFPRACFIPHSPLLETGCRTAWGKAAEKEKIG